MENWFDLWGAAVAVNTMCVQHGMQGRAVYLGKACNPKGWDFCGSLLALGQDDQITLSVGSAGFSDKGAVLASA